jgi:hypothetical protein
MLSPKNKQLIETDVLVSLNEVHGLYYEFHVTLSATVQMFAIVSQLNKYSHSTVTFRIINILYTFTELHNNNTPLTKTQILLENSASLRQNS